MARDIKVIRKSHPTPTFTVNLFNVKQIQIRQEFKRLTLAESCSLLLKVRCCHSVWLQHSCSTNTHISAKVDEEKEVTFTFPGTYVYGEPLCVLQIAEYFVRRQSDAFIHGVTTCAAVKSDAFRHGRRRCDARCVACLRDHVVQSASTYSVRGVVLQRVNRV